MIVPRPYPGLVIRYAYLWKREAESGRDEASEDRPCAIVLAISRNDRGETVLVLPVTHSPPANPSDAVEIPAMTKRRLGLDEDRSWVVITEFNEFTWPGPDLRPISGRSELTFAYGTLPPRFFATLRGRFLARYRQRTGARVHRTD